jgi:hypothetical protein
MIMEGGGYWKWADPEEQSFQPQKLEGLDRSLLVELYGRFCCEKLAPDHKHQECNIAATSTPQFTAY